MAKYLLFVTVTLCSIAVAMSKTSCIGKCPTSNPNDDVYLLPHEECSKFCSCNYGIAYVQICPPKLHYSPKHRVCTYPIDAECKGIVKKIDESSNEYSVEERQMANTVNSFSTDDQHCLGYCPKNNSKDTIVILPHRNCRKFCRCVDGTAESRNCPADFHFSEKLGVCTFPDVAECVKMATTSTARPATNEECCRCSDATSSSEKPVHTTSAYTITNSPNTPVTAGSGGTNDMSTDSTTKNPDPSSPWNSPGGGFCIGKCPKKDPAFVVHLPHKYCSKFCKCSNGYPYEFSCNPDLHFNPILDICDYPSKANCTGIKI